MGIDVKTFKRWMNEVEDKRKGPLTVPSNKLSKEEVEEIVRVSTLKKYMDLPPSQIVPLLADEGIYLASESTFYKILKENRLLEESQSRSLLIAQRL
jgi:putative transposase